MRNLALKYGPRFAAAGAGSLAMVGSAFAEAPAAFTTAVTDVTAAGVLMAAALVGIAAAVVVPMIAIKFVKRIRGTV